MRNPLDELIGQKKFSKNPNTVQAMHSYLLGQNGTRELNRACEVFELWHVFTAFAKFAHIERFYLEPLAIRHPPEPLIIE